MDFDSFDFLMGTEEKDELKVQNFNIDDLFEFEGHTFKVRMDKSMLELVESIQRNGVMEPITVRPRIKGGMEIIAGHRRWTACKMAGIKEIPGIIKNLDDDDAIIYMNDTNLKREFISPMERAASYKARFEAMDRKQLRLNFAEAGKRMSTRAQMAEEVGDSETNIYRYMRLMDLIPEFQQMVDEGKMEVYIGADVSLLSPGNQTSLFGYASEYTFKFDKDMVAELKKLEKAGKLNDDKVFSIVNDYNNNRQNEKDRKKKYNLKLSTEVIDKIPAGVKDRNGFIEAAIDFYNLHIKELMPEKQRNKKGKEI